MQASFVPWPEHFHDMELDPSTFNVISRKNNNNNVISKCKIFLITPCANFLIFICFIAQRFTLLNFSVWEVFKKHHVIR
jgi:hypothetical protein